MVKALIVDDSQMAADSLKQILTLLSVEASTAYGPRQALAVLKDVTPDVVFLDINMPGVTGFDVLGYLQREPRLQGVPVIIVSSENQPETQKRAKESGARAFILKPASTEAIESALKRVKLI